MQIAGSTILLTGASSGIGAALGPQLAERGATVGLVARRADRLAETLAACQVHSPDSRMWAADLSDLDAAAAVVDQAWDEMGGIDCLINNAAMGMRKPVLDQTPDDIERVMRTNFASPVRMALAVLPKMIERGGGTVINVGSAGGRIGIVHESSYCAAKFALSGWSEVAAMDLADEPVTIRLIQPGAIATEIWDERPGEVPGSPASFVSAEECAAGIVEALEGEGFETWVPAEAASYPEMRAPSIDGWIEMMAEVGRAKLP